MGFSHYKFKFYLQGRVAYEAGKLCLRLYFFWHEIEKKDFKRTYVLSYGPRLGHDEDVLAGKGFGCR